jgi:UDP-GlcNAc3NAcA epimerase
LKLLTVIGARPQFIKAVALSSVIRRRADHEEVLLHTGQHYDANMSDIFFRDLDLPEPKYRFNLGGGSHGEMTGRQIIEIEKVLVQERPDICLVYGDTNSTLAGSLAAAKLNIPIAHVEAGLRSFNKRMPEEVNRILTDHVSKFLFAPTNGSVTNLLKEGFDKRNIHLVGDVMYDVAKMFISSPNLRTGLVEQLQLKPRQFVVATLHRQENTDVPERLTEILAALARFSEIMPVILPIHPRTSKIASAIPEAEKALGSLIVLEPLGFFDMATLLSSAALAVTDSGGLQKEAYFYKVPCVTVRDETEWVELLDMGWNRLPDSISSDGIFSAMKAAIHAPPGSDAMPYGFGDAAGAILDVITGGSL